MAARGFFKRKLVKTKPNIDQIINDVLQDSAFDQESSKFESLDKESGITTDFEPYALSDVESDSGVKLGHFSSKKKYKYKPGNKTQNKTGTKQNHKSKKERDHEKMKQSKELYARIAQCGQNIAINDISKNCSNVILKETYMQCPFNDGHHVPAKNFKKHVKNCQRALAPRLELKDCPFNSNHIIPVCMFSEHVERCSDQKAYLGGIANNQAKYAVDLKLKIDEYM